METLDFVIVIPVQKMKETVTLMMNVRMAFSVDQIIVQIILVLILWLIAVVVPQIMDQFLSTEKRKNQEKLVSLITQGT